MKKVVRWGVGSRLRVVAVLTVAAAGVAGCGASGPDRIGGESVGKQVATYYRSVAAVDPASVKCEGVNAEAGAKSACTATDAGGAKWSMTAFVKKADGDASTYDIRFEDRIADNVAAQKSIWQALKSKTGSNFKAVECLGLQRLEINASRICTAIETNDIHWDVRHTLTDLSGGATDTLQDHLLYTRTVESIVGGLAWNLSQHYGLPRNLYPGKNADCPNMLRGKADETIHCKGILTDRSTTDVTVRTTSIEGDKIHFQLYPDNAPDLSMSGWQLADQS